jgi:hypothetical protein
MIAKLIEETTIKIHDLISNEPWKKRKPFDPMVALASEDPPVRDTHRGGDLVPGTTTYRPPHHAPGPTPSSPGAGSKIRCPATRSSLMTRSSLIRTTRPSLHALTFPISTLPATKPQTHPARRR